MKKTFLSLLLLISMVFSTATFAAGSTAKAEAPENFPALWEAGDTKNKIVTISDIIWASRTATAKQWKTFRCSSGF